MRKLPLTLCLVLGLWSLPVRGQDPLFSQQYAVAIFQNPAFAGSGIAPNLGVAYRYQWAGFGGAYKTYGAFYEQPLRQEKSGVGLMLEGDDAGNGILKTTRFHGAYAYFLPINASTQIRLGVEGGLLQTYLNWDRLVFPDQLDLLNGPVQVSQERRPESTNHLRLDVGSGLLLLSKSYYFGLSAKHLTTPDLSFLQVNNNLLGGLPIRFTVQGGMQLNVKPGNKKHESSFIAPNALYTRQGTFQQLLLGMYAGLGSVYLGSWLRHTLVNADAVIVLVGFRQGLLRLGLSYDATISRLSGRSGGTFELTTGINFGNDSRRQKIKSRKNLNNCMGMFY